MVDNNKYLRSFSRCSTRSIFFHAFAIGYVLCVGHPLGITLRRLHYHWWMMLFATYLEPRPVHAKSLAMAILKRYAKCALKTDSAFAAVPIVLPLCVGPKTIVLIMRKSKCTQWDLNPCSLL